MRPEANLAKSLTKIFCLRLVSWEQRTRNVNFWPQYILLCGNVSYRIDTLSILIINLLRLQALEEVASAAVLEEK